MICPSCNSRIPDDSQFCQCCGKNTKDLKNLSSKKEKKYGRVPIIVLGVTTGVFAVISVVMLVFSLNTVQALNYANDRINELETAAEKYESTEKDYKSLQTKYNSLQDDYDDLSSDYWDAYEKASFMDEHIVFVGADRERYHKFDCPLLDLSSFWAYNTEAARDDYRACNFCN